MKYTINVKENMKENVIMNCQGFNLLKVYIPICLRNVVMYPLRVAFPSSTGAANVVASPELMKIISMHNFLNPILKG